MNARTILHVEDNELNRKIVRDLLKRTSYRLIEAHDGEAAVTTALEQSPDLILMDIQLPKLSASKPPGGCAPSRRRRRSPSSRSLPLR